MSRTLASRCATQLSLLPRNAHTPVAATRAFSVTSSRRAEPPKPKPKTTNLLESIYGKRQEQPAAGRTNPMSVLTDSSVFQGLGSSGIDTSALTTGEVEPQRDDDLEPYHFHIYSTKHNTHVTCTKPNREPIISLSSGNLGYRKSRRGLYDSAYSLTKYVLDRLIHTGWPAKMNRVELVLRGFGQGREAGVKVLMSPEGKIIRDKIVRVADATRLKFGGTRSKRPRRL